MDGSSRVLMQIQVLYWFIVMVMAVGGLVEDVEVNQ